tara:strand:+ start:577 stop:1176 length:600 start_codon:yes stop_codon:yes gene_type:complete
MVTKLGRGTKTGLRFTVQMDASKVINLLESYPFALQKNMGLAARDIAGVYARSYLRALRNAGVEEWRGHGFDIIRRQISHPTPIGSSSLSQPGERTAAGTVNPNRGVKTYGIKVPLYLIALDRFKKQPHWVKLKRGRLITKWAQRKMGMPAFTVGGKPFEPSIKVKSHPWIDDGNSIARRRANTIIRQRLNQTRSEVKV